MLAEKISQEYADVFGSEATTKVRNETHHTEAYMTVNITDSTVKASEVDRVAAELCGMADCSCHPVQIYGGRVVNAHGEEYIIIEG